MLTFDVEDFISLNAPAALKLILEILEEYDLRAMFFITGHMAERLSGFPEILQLLGNHEIGFHSSSHSVRPIIAEFTDVKDYKEAFSISFERETSHIDPLTGKTKGEGGIYFLQDLFKPKKILAFRAPGMSWTPPHLEALSELGIRFDFSSILSSSVTVLYKGLTFYPYTFMQEWSGSLNNYVNFLAAISKRRIAIFDLHPTTYVNDVMWDSIFYKGNPKKLVRSKVKCSKKAEHLFSRFRLWLKRISTLRNLGLLEVNPIPIKSLTNLVTSENEIQKCYANSMRWPRRLFNYSPEFVSAHFQEFFQGAMTG